MTVVVPYDDSEQSRFALQLATQWFPDEEITLLHVLEPFADHTEAGGSTGSRYSALKSEADTLLEKAVENLDPGVNTRFEIRYGRPIHEIIHFVEENETTHVVIGSHGRDGVRRLFLGSVAETVVRRSPVPVTVVREDGDAGIETIEDVLVPFDASTESKTALSYALNHFPEASVTALYVVYPPREVTGPVTQGTPSAIEDWSRRIDSHTVEVLDLAEEIATELDRSIQIESMEGDPPHNIIDFAEDRGSDHIVMGSHGRDGLSRILLGSVAETVVRRAPTSVTVVR